jgi:2-(1,2-epoxy-1,2-dihydrophenyl)acetyl-CoA isomerase
VSTRLTLDFVAGAARISLSAPDRANAIDPAWAREFRDLTSGLSRRSDLRVVVLRSEGSAFCVGGDLRYFSSCADPYRALRELADDLHAGLLALAELDAPVLVTSRA